MSASIARTLGALAGLLACLASVAPAPALASDPRPSPSAKELWRSYPLKSRQLATGARATPARPAATAAPHGSGGGVTTLLVVVVVAGVCVAGAAGAIVWRARRVRRTTTPVITAPRMSVLVPAMPMLSGALAGGGPRQPSVTAARERPQPPAGAPRRRPAGRGAAARVAPLPSDPRRGWTAEIEWRPGDSDSRFWVMAAADDGSGSAPVAQSAALEWPPSGPSAVQALSDAARALEEALLSAGWAPLPAGDAWYAKRFRWEPRPAAPRPGPARGGGGAQPGAPRRQAEQPSAAQPAARRPAPAPVQPGAEPAAGPERSGRFKRDPQAWPAEARDMWRCELKWDAGYFNSRFQAVAFAPGAHPGRPVAAGRPFKWTFMSDPDPKGARHLAQVRGLASALEAAGWERIGRGSAWYALRFVWRREGSPPEHVALATGEAETAT